MLPTDAELNQMRADLEAMTLPGTCTILAAVGAADGMGGVAYTWGTAATHVHCRLDAVTVMEQIGGGGLNAYTRLQLTVPWDTALTTANQVKQGTAIYNVISVNPGDWLISKRAILEVV